MSGDERLLKNIPHFLDVRFAKHERTCSPEDLEYSPSSQAPFPGD